MEWQPTDSEWEGSLTNCRGKACTRRCRSIGSGLGVCPSRPDRCRPPGSHHPPQRWDLCCISQDAGGEIEAHSEASQAEAFREGLAARCGPGAASCGGTQSASARAGVGAKASDGGGLAPSKQSLHLIFAKRKDFAGEWTSTSCGDFSRTDEEGRTLQQGRAAEKPAGSDPNAMGAGWVPRTKKLSWEGKTLGGL